MEDKILSVFETEVFIDDSDKANLTWTPEGFLDCKNAVFAHVGSRKYHVRELDITDADSEYVDVYRTEDDLFSEQNLSSIKGKSVTDRHPSEMVSIKNWRKHELGVVYDSFRDGEFLKGNLLIKDEKEAKAVYSGKKRALSLGYKAKVVKDENGLYKFIGSINNHIALVAKGRDSEAFIMDSADYIDEKGGEEQVENQNITTKNKDIVDAVIENASETHISRNCAYDTETNEEIETVVETRVYRRKVDKEARLALDEQSQVVNKVVKDEKTKENKEKEKVMKTLLEFMNDYKTVVDSFPDSEAKVAELKRIDDECVVAHKVSLVPKKVEIKDAKVNPLNKVNPIDTQHKEEKEVKDERFIEVTDEQKEAYLSDFYTSLNPMSNIHDSFEEGKKRLEKLGSADINSFNRTLRKVGL